MIQLTQTELETINGGDITGGEVVTLGLGLIMLGVTIAALPAVGVFGGALAIATLGGAGDGMIAAAMPYWL